jgi:hypothetical protein
VVVPDTLVVRGTLATPAENEAVTLPVALPRYERGDLKPTLDVEGITNACVGKRATRQTGFGQR